MVDKETDEMLARRKILVEAKSAEEAKRQEALDKCRGIDLEIQEIDAKISGKFGSPILYVMAELGFERFREDRYFLRLAGTCHTLVIDFKNLNNCYFVNENGERVFSFANVDHCTIDRCDCMNAVIGYFELESSRLSCQIGDLTAKMNEIDAFLENHREGW